MSKHTPGPWMLNIDTVHIREGVSVQPVTHHMDSQGMADARLIAAAPDLLDALKRLLKVVEPEDSPPWDAGSEVEQARAAIAKAEGAE